MTVGASAKRSTKSGRPARRQKVTPHSLERLAIRHLDRYATSAANLKAVLTRSVYRIELAQEESFPEAPAWIDSTIESLLTRGYIDDRKFAISQAQRMSGRGVSSRRIQHNLRQKGVPPQIARDAVTQACGEGGELRAALHYARRHRLGPFRLDPELRASTRERDLATLGRSGFCYEIAATIVEAQDSESLESALKGPQ